MKKFLLLTVVMISFFYISEKANAGSIVEPYAGALVNATYDTDGGGDGDWSGTTVGARVGFSQMGFMAGLDGRRIFSTLGKSSPSGSDADYTFTQLGFFVGYELPIMFRFWGEYVFSMEGTDDDDSDNNLKKGSGTILGVGYAFLPFMSLNLELSNVTTTVTETATTSTDVDNKFSSILVSVSIPLHL